MRIFIAKNPRKAKHLFSPSKKRQSKMLKGLKRMKFFKHDDFYKFLFFRRSKINTSIKIEICKFRTTRDLFDWWIFCPIKTLPIFFFCFIFWKNYFETLLLPLFSHHWRQWVLDIMCFFSCAFIKGWTFSRSVKQCPLRPRKVIFSPTTYLHYSNFRLTDLWRFYIKPNDTKTPLRFLWRKLLQLNIYDLWVLKQNHEWVERIFLQTHKKKIQSSKFTDFSTCYFFFDNLFSNIRKVSLQMLFQLDFFLHKVMSPFT